MAVRMDPNATLSRRQEMVDAQLRARGIRDQRVLSAMLAIPRERFLPEEVRGSAYEDRAIPIGLGQTISQPYIVAYMTEQLAVTPECTVLEIGTGSGYQTAILSRLAARVFTVERVAALQEGAKAALAELGVGNVSFVAGDGSVGLPDHAPFDRIIVTAAAPRIPRPLPLQLVEGGLMILPIGAGNDQTVVRIERKHMRFVETPLLPCRFVRLIGEEAWEN